VCLIFSITPCSCRRTCSSTRHAACHKHSQQICIPTLSSGLVCCRCLLAGSHRPQPSHPPVVCQSVAANLLLLASALFNMSLTWWPTMCRIPNGTGTFGCMYRSMVSLQAPGPVRVTPTLLLKRRIMLPCSSSVRMRSCCGSSCMARFMLKSPRSARKLQLSTYSKACRQVLVSLCCQDKGQPPAAESLGEASMKEALTTGTAARCCQQINACHKARNAGKGNARSMLNK
jgi:hypothetical protein